MAFLSCFFAKLLACLILHVTDFFRSFALSRAFLICFLIPFFARTTSFFAFAFSLFQRLPDFFDEDFLLEDFFLLDDFLVVFFVFFFAVVFLEDLLEDFVIFLFVFFVLVFLAFFFIASRVVAVYWVVFGIDIAILAEWVGQVAFVGVLTGEGSCFRTVVALAQVLQAHFFYVFLPIIPPQNVVITEARYRFELPEEFWLYLLFLRRSFHRMDRSYRILLQIHCEQCLSHFLARHRDTSSLPLSAPCT